MDFKYFSKNGELLPAERAVVPLASIEYAYGFGVYETVRVSGGTAYFLQNHAERLLESAKIIGLEHSFCREDVENFAQNLMAATEAEAFNVKILLLGAPRKEDATLYVLCLNPLFPDKKIYKEGVDLAVVNYEREYPRAKTLNMLLSYLAYRKAKQSGCYDALLVDRRGRAREGTRTNFFAVKDGVVFSPPEEQILPGITRKAVLSVAAKIGVSVEEKEIFLDDLKNCDGAFITGTSVKIVPVGKIGDFEYGPIPETTTALMAAFDDFLKNCGGRLDEKIKD